MSLLCNCEKRDQGEWPVKIERQVRYNSPSRWQTTFYLAKCLNCGGYWGFPSSNFNKALAEDPGEYNIMRMLQGIMAPALEVLWAEGEEEYFPKNRRTGGEYPLRDKNGLRKYFHLNKQGAVLSLWPVLDSKDKKMVLSGRVKMRLGGGEMVHDEPIVLELRDLKRLRLYISEAIAVLEGRELPQAVNGGNVG
jgi:hypothetical protein